MGTARVGAACLAAACASVGMAQMVTSGGMQDFNKVFRIESAQRLETWRVDFMGSNVPAGILWPGDTCELRFRVSNNQDKPMRLSAKLERIGYGTRGIPGDIWVPVVFPIGKPEQFSVDLDVAAKSQKDFAVKVAVPETKGAYAFVLDLGKDYGRKFVTSVVRTFKPDPKRLQYPKMSLDNIGLDALQRLGIQAIREGIDFVPPSSPRYPEFRKRLDEEMKRFKDSKITVLLMVGAGGTQPLGRPRPHLDADGVMIGGKSDMAWVPAEDEEFRKFAYEISRDHGWPKGPVTAFSLWNEPWEGLSISGWGADMLRYREMYRKMAEGVHQARRDAGVTVLCAGADSSSNTLDKFFADGSDDFLPLLDALTIHYQGMSSPSAVRKFLNRKEGRVKIWDTESWVANTDDRIAAVIAANRAAGYDRSMGVFGGNIRGDGSTWAPAAALGAAQHFIGERAFRELVFPLGLPWVMRFDGNGGNADDSTIVVVGDLGEAFGADNVLHRGVRGLVELKAKEAVRAKLRALPIDAPLEQRMKLEEELRKPMVLSGGLLSLAASPADYSLYDFYGNPVPTKGKVVSVPLDHRGFFLRPSGKKGSFTQLLAAVKKARIGGFEPVEIVAHDFTTPVDKMPDLRLQVSNMLNVPVEGRLAVRVKGLQLQVPATVSLKPFESKTVVAKVTGGRANPQNLYPLEVDFESAQGQARHDEAMHANAVSYRSVNVDGMLDEWEGALPQAVVAQGANVTVATAAWWPMSKFEQSDASGFATGYTAYDDDFFYFAAKVADSTPEEGTYRFSNRNDDDFFYPQVSYEYNPETSLLKQNGMEKGSNPNLPTLPGGSVQKAYWENTNKNRQVGIDLQLPKGRRTRVAVYVGYGELHPNGLYARLVDPDTGNRLADKNWNQLWDGTYLVFEASQSVRLQIGANGDWYTAKAYALFFDDMGADSGKAPAFLEMDYDTKGQWSGKYGQLGYFFAEGPSKLPESVTVAPVEKIERTEYRWPDGMRKFSYRQWPVLPVPYESATYDNVQIAFNVLGPNEKWMIPNLPGVPYRFIDYPSTDYEFSLNQVAPQYGGGTEVWRMLAPGMPRKHFYPRQPKSPQDGPVTGAKLAIVHQGNTRTLEVAIPWAEMPEVRKAMQGGRTVKFTFRVTDGAISAKPELGAHRSVSKASGLVFHVDWNGGWANEVEFGFEEPGDK